MKRLSTLKKRRYKPTILNLSLYPKLNKLIGGIRSSELITIGARVGCGKTTLAINLASDFASQGIKTLFLSCEMKAEDLWYKVDKSLKTKNQALFDNLFIEDRSHLIDIKFIEKMIKKNHFRVIFIDYLQIMNGKIKEITRQLKLLCNKYGVVIISLAQLNRKAENVEPMLSMLKDSGTIEQDSDEVWFIKEYNIKVAKNRKGQIGEIDIIFCRDNSLIYESTERADEIKSFGDYVESLFDNEETIEYGKELLYDKLYYLDIDRGKEIHRKYMKTLDNKIKEHNRNILKYTSGIRFNHLI